MADIIVPSQHVSVYALDWSGTVSDDRQSVYESNMRIFDAHGKPRLEYWDFFDQTTLSFEGFARRNGLSGSQEDLLGLYATNYEKVVADGIRPHMYYEVPEVVEHIKRKDKPIVIVSSHPEKALIREIKEYGMNGNLGLVLGGLTSKADKFESIAKSYGTYPGNILFVGDTTFDMISGREAGVIIAAVGGPDDENRRGYHTRSMLSAENPDFILEDFKGLMDV